MTHPIYMVGILALLCLYGWVCTVRYGSPYCCDVRLALRVGTMSLLCLSLSGVQVAWTDPQATVVFVLDVSESIAPADRLAAVEYVKRAMTALPTSARVGLVMFGQDAVIEQAIGSQRTLSTVQAHPVATSTNIAQALHLAIAMLGSQPQKRLVLLSDGNETMGDARRTAALAAAQDIVIDVLPLNTLRTAAEHGVILEETRAPAQVRVREPFEVAVTLRGATQVPLTVQLYDNGRYLAERQVVIPEHEQRTLYFSQRIDSPGVHRYISTIARQDHLPSSQSGTVVYAHGTTQVLYVTTSHTPTILQEMLAQQAFEVSRLSPARLPTSATALLPYDVVIVDNVAAHSITAQQMQTLADYVETLGGGLLMTGSTQSFGPGGYAQTALERILPVDMQVAARAERPPVAVILLLDKSGSMAGEERGRQKIDLAKEAIAVLLPVLDPTDTLGVIAFDRTPHALLEPQQVGALTHLQQQLQPLQAGGGTALQPALALALQWLQGMPGSQKHVLLLSDGQTEPGDFPGLMRAFVEAQITLSVVGIGPDADQKLLQDLAARGQGRIYLPESMTEVPALFAREGSLLAGKWVQERHFTPRLLMEHEMLSGLYTTTTLPDMGGYVASTPKTMATVLLVSDTQDPLLACWRFGLGKTLVLTSDAASAWMTHWLQWPAFGRLWAQMVRWTSRRQPYEQLHPRITLAGDTLQLVLDAFESDGRWRNFLDIRTVMYDPGDKRQERRLTQTASGHYEASFTLQGTGAYVFHVLAAGTPEVPEASSHFGFYVAALPEYQASQTNMDLLQDITRMTQGALLTRAADPTPLVRPGTRQVDLWPIAVTAALLCFISESLVGRGFGVPSRRRRGVYHVESNYGSQDAC